ncbi:MAG: hypothetical protein U1E69_16840 [Tabrizicola sp.]|uniref:hypothetical protein n=1 Tax=Tabrizicola sp. TaxID=2005166 RepID=UPI002AB8F43D|nr:hypothetical protein [Tabrizicola sp.]MDZ4088458.1 hypothetical protein [Tabrizicola sp.]
MAALQPWPYNAALQRPIFKARRKDIIMFNLFKSLINGTAFPRIADLERAYLNASASRIDLERRQREVENGLFRRSSFDL